MSLYKKAKLFIGSNRQSQSADNYASKTLKTDSFFPIIKNISNLLKIPLDTVLMSDIYGNKQMGDTFNKSINENKTHDSSQWLLDKKKYH